MKQAEKDYTCKRIQELTKKKTIACACDTPCTSKHYQSAAIRGLLELRKPEEIKKAAEKRALSSGSYRDEDRLNFVDLFELPASYLAELKEFEAEQAKHEAENKRITDFAAALVDKVQLNKFENGETAIAEIIAFI